MSGKELRLSTFLDPIDGRSLLLEADYGLMLGHFEKELNLRDVLSRAINAGVDGVIISRGMVKRLSELFLGRRAPALLLRADWTNVWRGSTHPLPAREHRYMSLTDAEDAMRMGASALVAYLFLGYRTDYDDARNVEALSELAVKCDEWDLPLLVEAIPAGERVVRENYLDALGLVMRIAVEIGASCVAVPYPGDMASLKKLVDSCQVPLLLLEELEVGVSRWQPSYDVLQIAQEALEMGVSGFVLGLSTLLSEDMEERVRKLREVVHGGEPNGGQGA